MGPRAGLDQPKILFPPRFDPGPSSPWSVAIPTKLYGPRPIRIVWLKEDKNERDTLDEEIHIFMSLVLIAAT